MSMIATVLTHKHGHDRLYVCIYAKDTLLLCVHTSVGMIAHMGAYSRRHKSTYVCMHARVGMIAPMLAYERGHDRAYACI
jgi:hypothetical protein